MRPFYFRLLHPCDPDRNDQATGKACQIFHNRSAAKPAIIQNDLGFNLHDPAPLASG